MNNVIRQSLILVLLLSALALPRSASSRVRRAGQIEFSREVSEVGASPLHISSREATRIERFLAAVFPVTQMRHCARRVAEPASYQPISRRVTYAVIEQEGIRFVLVGYCATWRGIAEQNGIGGLKNAVNELALYRMEPAGLNQVWRAQPWQVNYSGLHFWTAKTGSRNVVLFQEGGTEGEFGLASVFSFYNQPKGLLLRDLTPSLPWLRARERFPFRTLYGQDISFRVNETKELVLSASGEAYDLSMSRKLQPACSWIYDKTHNRFERRKEFTEVTSRQ